MWLSIETQITQNLSFLTKNAENPVKLVEGEILEVVLTPPTKLGQIEKSYRSNSHALNDQKVHMSYVIC